MSSARLRDGWRSARIDRVATVRARIGWKALTADEYKDDGYAFLATPNIKGVDIDFDNVNYISEYRYDESPELKLAIGDVLLAKDGNTLGITNVVTYLPRAATVNGSIAVIRPTGVDSRFMRYWIASDYTQRRIDSLRAGMGVPHLFQWDINRLPIMFPARQSDQTRIADFLDAETARIDALIAKKRTLVSAVLERQTVWLNAYFSRNGDRYKLKRLLARPPCYGVLVPSFDDENGTPFVRVGDISRLRVQPEGLRKINLLQSVEYSRTIVNVGDILLSVVGAVDKVAVVDEHLAGANLARAVARLVPRADVPSLLLAYWLNTTQYRDQARLATQSDTAQPTLNMGDLSNFEVSFPVVNRVKHMNVCQLAMGRYTRVVDLLEGQIRLLKEHRQALITAAVTGEMEVPGVSR